MKSSIKILFYLRKERVNKNGEAPIFCRITVSGSVTRFNLSLSCDPNMWNSKFCRASGRSKNAVEINDALDSYQASILKVYRAALERDNYVDAEKVKNVFLGFSVDNRTILSVFQEHIENTEKLVGKTTSKATLQKYKVTKSHIAAFMKSKHHISDINIKEINYHFLVDFEIYLLTTGKCGHNTTVKFMQFFKRIIIIAIKSGWIVGDPFMNYKMVLKRVDRGYLSESELNNIANKEFSTDRLNFVRDIFIFCCYTGLAYIDAKNLSHEEIKEGFNGKLWIKSKRVKTGTKIDVPLMKIPLAIIEKYKGTVPKNLVLPVLSNQKMNSYLKEIAAICEINSNLTFHVARHTFATTVTLGKGVPMESVSKMLAHTNLKTTQIYAKITNEKVALDMDVLSEKLDALYGM